MITLIKELFLFNNVDFDVIDKKYTVIDKIINRKYEDGDRLLASDDGEKGIFLVLEGCGKIVSVSKKHNAPLRLISRGDTFGAATLYGGQGSHRTEVISCGSLTVALLPPSLVDELIQNESTIAFNYIRFLSDRINFLNRKIAAFSAGSADEKLALYLLSLNFTDGKCTLCESFTNIAKSLDLGRASLYRAIENFEKNNIIHREGHTIYLDNRNLLFSMIS